MSDETWMDRFARQITDPEDLPKEPLIRRVSVQLIDKPLISVPPMAPLLDARTRAALELDQLIARIRGGWCCGP